MTTPLKTLTIDGLEIPINGERNLLELIRKADIDLPTFCYHSDLSVYGACRLCIVDIEGRGIQGACSTPPEPGLKIRTRTQELREIRKITIELLLANHDSSCPTCPKNTRCQLQDLARKLGVDQVRFKPVHEPEPLDTSSCSLVRNPNKCVLCGDCVRVCSEIQGIGAIDFAHRGHQVAVIPAFGKPLAEGECVNCGQCAAVCPTGALSPKSEVEAVWRAINDPAKTVAVQVAPAVRVALGEAFGQLAGTATTGQIVAALRRIGFDLVYDTAFAADLTVVEEATEFLGRKKKGERLPQFTSCCPGWVKFAEQYFPELLGNLSTCRSPQQMFGALCKATLPATLGIERKNLTVVAIMPCTAKKFEARRTEFATDGQPDVDYVLTTQELAQMIDEAGIHFNRLEVASFDMPLGFKTGAGVIFGNSGGVSEAVLRYAAEKITGEPLKNVEFPAVRGEDGLRTATVAIDGIELRLAVVHGLGNARKLAEQVRRGEAQFDLIEVMACPGGCIGGAGQPITQNADTRRLRTRGLYDDDRKLDLHKSQENLQVTECYRRHLGEVGGPKAHELLHTHYQSRRRIADEVIELDTRAGANKTKVRVCVGTNCFLRGSQAVLKSLLEGVGERQLESEVEISASFCFENCAHGATVRMGDRLLCQSTPESALEALEEELKKRPGQAVGVKA